MFGVTVLALALPSNRGRLDGNNRCSKPVLVGEWDENTDNMNTALDGLWLIEGWKRYCETVAPLATARQGLKKEGARVEPVEVLNVRLP
jgi:hypothetical protein